MGRRESELIGLAVYGLTAHTHALARAVLVLDEVDGETAGIVPLVRQAMECAITAVWLELAGYPAVLTLVREQSRQQRNVINEFIKSGATARADMALERIDDKFREGLLSASKAGERFEERCKEVEGAASTYAVYRALSATSHAGASVIDLYLASTQVDENSRATAALRIDPGDPASRESHLGILLAMLLTASAAWSRIDRRRYVRTRIKELARELELPFRSQMSAYGYSQQRKREQEYRIWKDGKRAEPAGAGPPDPSVNG